MTIKPFFACTIVLGLIGCTEDDVPEPVEETEIVFDLQPPGGISSAPGVAFVAYQEGDGEWKLMSGQGGVFRAVITSERYGVAAGCLPRALTQGGSLTSIVVHQTTVGETKVVSDATCFSSVFPAPPSREVSIAASGLGASESGRLETTFPHISPFLGNGAFAWNGPLGSHPVFALVRAQGAPSNVYARVRRLPDLDFSTATSMAVDFGQGVAPVTFPLTLPQDVSGANVTTSVRRGPDFIAARMQSSATQITSVPTSELRDGDALRISAVVDDGDERSRFSYLYLSAPGPATMTFPTHWSLPAPTVAPTGRRLLSAKLPEVTSAFPIVDTRLSASATSADLSVSHDATISRGWRSEGAKTYLFPDFSTLPGYATTMDLPAGANVAWSVSVDELNRRDFAPGRILLSAVQEGVIAK